MTGFLALFASLATDAASQASDPKPLIPLHRYVTDDDYPAEALMTEQQGTVGFRLSIGSNGVVKGCTITQSSGSPTLDETSCSLMGSRARFEPAKDRRGRPIEGTFDSRITWRIDASDRDGTPAMVALNALTLLWGKCVHGEAAKLTLSALAPERVYERAAEICASMEPGILTALEAAELPGTVPLEAMQTMMRRYRDLIVHDVGKARAAIQHQAGPPAPALQ